MAAIATGKTFTYLVAPEDFLQRPPFPERLPFETIPPPCNILVKNRRVPRYCLGWRYTWGDFEARFNPDGRWRYPATAYRNSDVHQAWRAECLEHWPSADPSVVTFGDELLLYVTDNVDTPDRNGRGIGMERCKDEALMENVKRVFGHTEDPQWYRACNMRRRSSSHVAYGSFTLC
ncbi:hypothetical protein OH76DRAFT_1560164 [Lentinus brumalis]|uniref:Uncharacterized protein n=1 Tax=Lentinus brumalis TaxID=2498619 RepID=A0A371CTY6_9APHY|nr:hypothetical protein OH76DRAFT_1560164 [Polyporus brumalis]